MSRWRDTYGPWALITGASSGIGAELAKQVTARGLNIILVARSAAPMEALGKELSEAHGVEHRVCAVDLSARGFVDELLPQIEGLEIGLLVNNAGFTTTGALLDYDIQTNARMIDLNCQAPLLLTHALAPAMRERKRGGVIITASIVAWGGAAGWATYNATKAFDLLLAEGLAAELEPHGVDVLALCPAATRSGFQAAGGVREAKDTPLAVRLSVGDVAPVASAALASLGRTRVVVPGLMNKLMALSMRFLPRRLNSYILGTFVKLMSH